MAKEYSIILKGKSIASLISFAAKKFGVPESKIKYDILANPTPPSNLFKLKITAIKEKEENIKKQKLKLSHGENKTKLYLTAFPPENDEISFEVNDIVEMLVTKHKIACKIDKWEIQRAITLSTKTNKATKVLIAKGTSPEKGDDGLIELIPDFVDAKGNLCDKYIKETLDILYKCDYVEKNSIIAVIHKPKKGQPGKDIYGGSVEGIIGNQLDYSVHKHIICVEFPNRTELRSPESGRITFYRNLFRFYQVLEKKNPIVGKKTNIKVDGDLIIDEYIENGAKVDVKGNLQVKDDIFNAFVDCHGDLTVENGISNSKKGFITINGNLNCSFLQKALVWVEIDINLKKSILNSEVYCGNDLFIKENGIIRNSEINVFNTLKVDKIENCKIRCGISFSTAQRFKRLNKNLNQLFEEKTILEKKIGPSFLSMDVRKLTLENEMLQDVYKKKRELYEINLNIDSLNKEIELLISKKFNEKCSITAKQINKGSVIRMKNEELLIENDLENIYIFYDVEKKQISIYNNIEAKNI